MISFAVKKIEWHEKRLIKELGRIQARVFRRFGSFVRRTAMLSIKSVKVAPKGARSNAKKYEKVSQPGNPPKSHTGLLRDLILFDYSAESESVIVGPKRLHNVKGRNVPEILEYGGRSGKGYIMPRPYMWPAFEENEPKLPEIWRKYGK